MDVGDWITEPELHAPDRAGPGSESSRRWFDSFSARLRFARLGCFAAKVELLSAEKALPKGQAVVIVGKAWLPCPAADFLNKLLNHASARHHKTKLTANSCIARSSSKNAVSISSGRTMNRLP